jgi:hypothetical protein
VSTIPFDQDWRSAVRIDFSSLYVARLIHHAIKKLTHRLCGGGVMEEVAHPNTMRRAGACVNGCAETKSYRRKIVPATFSSMPWPKTVPDDLRRRLEAVLGYRNRPAPQDVWGAVVEWLESEKVEPTERPVDRIL